MMEVQQILESNSMPITESGCRIWLGSTDRDGYGRVTMHGKSRLVHRVSYECYKGPIPAHLRIDHKCRVRPCLEPEHLQLATVLETVMQGAEHEMNRTHCDHGHKFTSENVGWVIRQAEEKKYRYCRICQRAVVRAYKLRKKGQPT